MAKILTEHQIKSIFLLREKGLTYHEIAAQTGISRISVSRHITRGNKGLKPKRETNKEERQQLIDKMANDRITMRRYEVAKKYGMCDSNVGKLLANHPLQKQFLGKELRFDKKAKTVKPNLIPIKEYPKLKPKKETKAKQLKDKFESLEGMEKGHVKLQKKEKVLPTRSFNVNEQRHVHIPSKNMTISVSKSDTRTNEEIINAFLDKDREYIESCKNNPMNKHSKSYHPIKNIKKQAS